MHSSAITFLILFGQRLASGHPQGAISLEYKPMRPSYHPNPGNNIQQIVPPGEPWPARPQDYANFSQTTTPWWFTRTSATSQQATTTTTGRSTVPITIITTRKTTTMQHNNHTTTERSFANNASQAATLDAGLRATTAATLSNQTAIDVETNATGGDEEAAKPTTEPTVLLYTSKAVLTTLWDEKNANDKLNATLANNEVDDDAIGNVSDLLAGPLNITTDALTTTTTAAAAITTAKRRVNTDRLAQSETSKLDGFSGNEPEAIQLSEQNDKADNASDAAVSSTSSVEDESSESDESYEIARAIEIFSPLYDNIRAYLPKFVYDSDREESERERMQKLSN